MADQRDAQTVLEIRAINEQLLLAGLREQALAEQLQAQLVFTTAITTGLGEGVFAVDRNGLLTFVNPAAEQLLGWGAEDVLERDVDSLLPLAFATADLARAHASPLELVLETGATYRDESAVWTRRDVSTFPVAYSAAPLRREGQVVGAVVTFRDITETQRYQQLQDAYTALELEVRRRTEAEQARQALLQKLVTAQEEERRRISRELHDQTGQDLSALILGLKALADALTPTAPTRDRLAQIQALAIRLDQHVHTLAVQLRPTALDDLGLTVALTTYLEEWSAQAQVVADMHTIGLDGPRLPLAVDITLYRLVQEALTNVLKHAQATTVSVIIERRRDRVRLIVEDDGVGFDVDALEQTIAQDHRLGLLGMHERVALLSGTLTIEATAGRGTTLFVTIPLSEPHEEAHDAETPNLPGG